MWLGIVSPKQAGTSLKMSLLGWQHMLLQNLHVPFSINGAYPNSIRSQMLAFELCADSNLDGPFPL